MTARYQYGDLIKRKRKKGPDVWQFRYAENGRRKSVLVGTVAKLPTKADAIKAIEHRRMEINSENPQQRFHSVTVQGLAEWYKEEELPTRYSTRVSYLSYLNCHIIPRWRAVHLEGVRPLDVEAWLRQLSLAEKTKAHIRGLMHVLFDCARRWDYIQVNPIELVLTCRSKRICNLLIINANPALRRYAN